MSCYPVLYFEKEVVAVVLCGGLSTRMGQDKGLLLLENGENWVQKAVSLCQNLGLTTYVSINKSQKVTYEAFFDASETIVDIYDNIGPVNGVLSAYNQLLDKDYLLLSCDMLNVDEDILFNILKQHELLSEYDALIFENEGFYQPFPGLYSSEFLNKLSLLHHGNMLEKYSFQHIFKNFSIYTLAPSDDIAKKLKSFNQKKDLGV